MGCAKAFYPSLSGQNSTFVNDVQISFGTYDSVEVGLCKLYCSLSFKESCDLTIIGFH